MRAKIMILSGNDQAKRLAFSVQGVLSDLAIAFGHSFLMKEEKISTASVAEYGSAMTQEAIDEAKQCDAVLCLTDDGQGVIELAAGIGSIVCGHVYQLPEMLAQHSLLKSGTLPHGLIAWPLSTQPNTLTDAAVLVYGLSKAQLVPIREIPLTGKRSRDWMVATGSVAAQNGQTQPHLSDVNHVLEGLLTVPEEMGIVFATPSAASSVHAVASSLSGLSPLLFDTYWDKQRAIAHAVQIGQNAAPDMTNPFGALYAAAHMLKHTLRLTREADCLLTSIHNVLEAGWRTPDMQVDNAALHIGTEAICGLISQQIELAGALVNLS